MPLRDHFRPPLDLITSWEGFHGQMAGGHRPAIAKATSSRICRRAARSFGVAGRDRYRGVRE